MLMCNFNKNVFYNNEEALCNYTFDNSKSNLNVREIEFELLQDVEISAKRLIGTQRFKHIFEILENKNKKIIVAGYPEQL